MIKNYKPFIILFFSNAVIFFCIAVYLISFNKVTIVIDGEKNTVRLLDTPVLYTAIYEKHNQIVDENDLLKNEIDMLKKDLDQIKEDYDGLLQTYSYFVGQSNFDAE